MKINVIMPGAGPSGGIRMVFQYAQNLTEQGHDVTCYFPLTGAYSGWKKILFMKLVICTMRYPAMRGGWFKERKFKLEMPFIINNKTVRTADVTIATSWITAYWVEKLSSDKGKKVYFVQGFETWYGNHRDKKVLNSYRIPFDKIITVSTALQQRLLKETGVESVVVCNGIPKEELRKYTIDNTHKELVSIAFPYREGRNNIKNCDTAIEVLKRVQAIEKVQVMSYGFKKPDEWEEDWIFLEDPSRKQLYEFYEKADIFYVPSIYEGWGLPAMEAMGHEAAVLAGNSGVIAEFGQDDINCKVLENPLDIEETVEKLVELIRDNDKRCQIGKNAFEIVSKEYTFEQSVKRFEKILLSILECSQNSQKKG